MKKELITAIAAVFAISAGAAGLYANDHDHASMIDSHSGGTDKYGCHTNHETGDYHCHNSK